MSFIETFILALALSADSFSVGAAYGVRHNKPRQIFRLSLHFGIFQSLMTGLGIVTGVVLLDIVDNYGSYIASGILVLIGVRMIYESLNEHEVKERNRDLTKGWNMVASSLAVSIDAFAAGIGLKTADAALVPAVLLIGFVSTFMTIIGMNLSRRIPSRFIKRAELLAGLVLILLGLNILSSN